MPPHEDREYGFLLEAPADLGPHVPVDLVAALAVALLDELAAPMSSIGTTSLRGSILLEVIIFVCFVFSNHLNCDYFGYRLICGVVTL